MDLRGAVVVVTGASSGIGRATALAFAARGAIVVGAARRTALLDELVAQIERRDGRALAVACDVADREQVQRLHDRVRDEFGRCEVLVNNAGIGGSLFEAMTLDEIERVVRVNVLGVMSCTRVFLPLMLDGGRGHVVNVASLAGRFATPGSSVYAATKHAVVGFSEALHFEVAPRGVRVTAVNPGFVETEGFPHRGRHATGPLPVLDPEPVADLIVRVVERGIAPERSIPRWIAGLQAVRILAPPIYRAALSRVSRLRTERTGGPDGGTAVR